MDVIKVVIENIWKWLGDQNNHNALIAIITFLGFLAAIKKVDSLQKSINSLFKSVEKEIFGLEAVIDCFKNVNEKTYVDLKLKHEPIQNSVNLWEGALHISPEFFEVKGSIVTLLTNFDKDSLEDTHYVVTYIPII